MAMFGNGCEVVVEGRNSSFTHTSQGDINQVIVNASSSNADSNLSKAFKALLKQVATGAYHNSSELTDAPKCHPGTRLSILKSLFAWAAASTYIFFIQWLHGPAGAGKSAILRTVAETLEKHGLLLGSFFFFRAAPGRNSADRFVATLAYQISLSVPTARPHIEGAIQRDPLIFTKSLDIQTQALIVLPLIEAKKEGSMNGSCPRVLVVDGLDECQGESKQCEILKILNNMASKLPFPVAILIASRPEHHIRDTFDTHLNKSSSRLSLDQSYQPDEDIRKFYDDKFNDICLRHPLRSSFPNPWPSPSTITTLVEKASGQFIFASTVIKFVEPHRYNPAQRLEMILGRVNPGQLKPFEQLDTLYMTIFAALDPNDLPTTLRVLGAVLVRHVGPSLHHLGRLSHLTGYSSIEITQLFFDLESLMKIEKETEYTSYIKIHHASLADFLFDSHRSAEFFIDPSLIYEWLAIRCIDVFVSSADIFSLAYFKDNVQTLLQKANASPDGRLYHTLKNYNVSNLAQLNGQELLLCSLSFFHSTLLPGIVSSPLLNAKTLHANLLRALEDFIKIKVDAYFQGDASFVLVYLLEPPSSSPPFWGVWGDCHFPNVPPYLTTPNDREVDKIHGFFLLKGKDLTHWGQLYLLSQLARAAIGGRAGECYAHFTWRCFQLLCTSAPPSLPALGSPLTLRLMPYSAPRDPTPEDKKFMQTLVTVLSKSSPQGQLVQLLRSLVLDAHLGPPECPDLRKEIDMYISRAIDQSPDTWGTGWMVCDGIERTSGINEEDKDGDMTAALELTKAAFQQRAERTPIPRQKDWKARLLSCLGCTESMDY